MDHLAKHPRDSASFEAIDIFMFTNGQQYSPPRKYHLNVDELNNWEVTLASLARSQFGALHSKIDVYTISGVKISNPMELANGGAYVAVKHPDTFTDTGYHKYLIKASRSWEKRQQRRTELLGLSGSDNANTSKSYDKEMNNNGCDNFTCSAKKIPCKKPYKCTKPFECRKSPVNNPKSNVTRLQPNNNKIPLVAKRSPTKRKSNITKTEIRNRTNSLSPYKTVTAHILKHGRNIPTISGSIKIKNDLPIRSVSPINNDNKKEVSNNTTAELRNDMIKEDKTLIFQEQTNISSNIQNSNYVLKPNHETGENKYELLNEIKIDVYHSGENITGDVKSETLINKSPTKKQSIEVPTEPNVKLENNTICNIYNGNSSDNKNSDKYDIRLEINEIPNTSDNNLTPQTKNKTTKYESIDEKKPSSCDDVCYLKDNKKEDNWKQSSYSVYRNPSEEKNSTVFVCEEQSCVNGNNTGKIKILFETDESVNIPTKDELGNIKYNDIKYKETCIIKQCNNVATNYETIPDDKQSKTKLFQNNESQTSEKVISKERFDKYSTLIHKGDVLNLKLTIEVRNNTNSSISGQMKLEKESQAELNINQHCLNNTSDANTFLLDTIDSSQLNEKYSKLIIVQCSCSHNNLLSLNNGQNHKGNNKKILYFPGDVTPDLRCKCGIISPEKVNKYKHTDYIKKNNINGTNHYLKQVNVISPSISAKRKESLRVQEMVATLEQNMKSKITDLPDTKKKISESDIGYDENGQDECEMNNGITKPCCDKSNLNNKEKTEEGSPTDLMRTLSLSSIEVMSKLNPDKTEIIESVKKESIDEKEYQQKNGRVKTLESICKHGLYIKTQPLFPEADSNTNERMIGFIDENAEKNNENVEKRISEHATQRVANPGISGCKECSEMKLKIEPSEHEYHTQFADKTTQTDWRESILEARLQKDGRFTLHYPSIQTLRLYNL